MAHKANKEDASGNYRSILLWIFRNGEKDTDSGDLLFTQADLRQAADELQLQVRNFPDLVYNLRSRASLPEEILAAGFTTIAIRGRGKYALVTAENSVIVPTGTQVARVDSSPIPEAVRDLLRATDQSILSVIRYLDLVSDFTGVPSYHLQGHLRTTGSLGQQVEADDVWVGQAKDGTRMIFPIEAKGPKEHLGRHQMMSTVDAVRKKIPDLPVIPLAVHLEKSGLLAFIEFAYETTEGKITSMEPVRFKHYRISPKLPQWP